MTGASRRPRVAMVGVALASFAVLMAASAAWACTPTANLKVSAGKANSGTSITLTGVQFHEKEVTVSLLKDDGQFVSTLWAGKGPEFTQPVTIPSVQPGMYIISARSDGSGYGSNVFIEVTSPAGDESPSVPQPSAQATPTQSAVPAQAPTQSSQATATQPAAVPTANTPAATTSPAVSAIPDPAPTQVAAASPAQPRVRIAPTASASPGPAAASPERSAVAEEPQPAAEPADEGTSADQATGSSERSRLRLGTSAAGDRGLQFGSGVFLLSVGLVGLVAAAGIPAVRRQRASALATRGGTKR